MGGLIGMEMTSSKAVLKCGDIEVPIYGLKMELHYDPYSGEERDTEITVSGTATLEIKGCSKGDIIRITGKQEY